MSFINFLAEQQALEEMAINPSVLNRFLSSEMAERMTVGIEAEMVMPHVKGERGRRSSDANEEALRDADLSWCESLYHLKKAIKDAIEDVTGDNYFYERIEEEIDDVFDIDGRWWGSFYDGARNEYEETFEQEVYADYKVNGKDILQDIFAEKMDEYFAEEDEELPPDDREGMIALYDKMLDFIPESRKWKWEGIQFNFQNYHQEMIDFLNREENKIGNFSTQTIVAVMKLMQADLEDALEEKRDDFDYDAIEQWYEEENDKNILQGFLEDNMVDCVMDFLNKWIDNREIYDILGANEDGGNDFNDGGAAAEYYAEELKNHVDADVGVNYTYHGENTDRDNDWTLEPDSSIHPDDDSSEVGIEFVSPPMLDLSYGLEQIEAALNYIKSESGYNNTSTGFHINLSLPFSIQKNVDLLKLMLLLGDQHVLGEFGRSNNQYAESSLKKARNMMASRSNATEIIAVLDSLRETLVDGNAAASKDTVRSALGNAFGEMAGSKFVSINVKNDKYIEFRSAGGYDYIEDWTKLKLTILRFAYVLSVAADPQAEKQEYMKKLYKFVQNTVGKSSDPIIAKFVQYVAMSAAQPERVAEFREQLKKLLVVKKEVKGGKETVEQWITRIMNTKEVDMTMADFEVMAGDNPTPLELEYRDALLKKLPSSMYGRLVGNAWTKLHPDSKLANTPES